MQMTLIKYPKNVVHFLSEIGQSNIQLYVNKMHSNFPITGSILCLSLVSNIAEESNRNADSVLIQRATALCNL